MLLPKETQSAWGLIACAASIHGHLPHSLVALAKPPAGLVSPTVSVTAHRDDTEHVKTCVLFN